MQQQRKGISTDILLLLFSHLDVFDSLWPHGLQHTRIQFSSVQSLSHVQLFENPWISAHQASLSITNSWCLLKLKSIELVMPSNHLILCRPLLFLPPITPSIRVFSIESTLCMRWPKYWSFSFNWLLEFAQTHIHWVHDAIQPSHSLSPPLLLMPSMFPSNKVFYNESALLIRWSKSVLPKSHLLILSQWALEFNI